MQSFSYTITDPLGLHARPAALLVKAAAHYQSTVTISTTTGTADAKRIMSVMRLAAKQGTELIFIVEGLDEADAVKGLKSFLLENL